MRNNSRSWLTTVLALTAVAASGACAHRRQIYDSSDFARRPIVRQRPALARAPARSRLASEPKLSRVVDEREDPPTPDRDELSVDRD